jgi:hypothetical protein
MRSEEEIHALEAYRLSALTKHVLLFYELSDKWQLLSPARWILEFPSRESRDDLSRRGVALSREKAIIYEVSERAIRLDGYRA